ncbi:hypothetical protein PHLCEN_2v5128 [Hermanssonia centrifuga]|uniref:Uncharacterized protein n=1 Tax=Hermanssonia centrifuga TaxID=98765 RepID=A0A2R6PBV0_9APHY|nr:hypothetical protein PHLCEN_2v5128 [Hermanssonia centrifuga]
MPLDDAGMRRLGHAFVYRIIPVLAATILYGIYIALLFQATHGLRYVISIPVPPATPLTLFSRERGLLKSRANSMILFILYFLFLLTTTLWALEVAQLFGLNQILFHPNDLSTDSKFNSFYDLIASETRVTGILFETQVSVSIGDSEESTQPVVSDDRR